MELASTARTPLPEKNNTGSNLTTLAAGVWGDGGVDFESQKANVAVLGTTDDWFAVYGENNSSDWMTFSAENESSLGSPFCAANPVGGCCIQSDGSMTCSG